MISSPTSTENSELRRHLPGASIALSQERRNSLQGRRCLQIVSALHWTSAHGSATIHAGLTD